MGIVEGAGVRGRHTKPAGAHWKQMFYHCATAQHPNFLLQMPLIFFKKTECVSIGLQSQYSEVEAED